jgi:hypothetical protein
MGSTGSVNRRIVRAGVLEPQNLLQPDQVWILRFWPFEDSLGEAAFSRDAQQRIPTGPAGRSMLALESIRGRLRRAHRA